MFPGSLILLSRAHVCLLICPHRQRARPLEAPSPEHPLQAAAAGELAARAPRPARPACPAVLEATPLTAASAEESRSRSEETDALDQRRPVWFVRLYQP